MSGYISGSGNYIIAFMPVNTCGKTVTSISASATGTTVFTVDGNIPFSNAPTIAVSDVTKFGMKIEVTLPSTQTANRPGTIILTNLSVVCS